jgi:hypothetical protein
VTTISYHDGRVWYSYAGDAEYKGILRTLFGSGNGAASVRSTARRRIFSNLEQYRFEIHLQPLQGRADQDKCLADILLGEYGQRQYPRAPYSAEKAAGKTLSGVPVLGKLIDF